MMTEITYKPFEAADADIVVKMMGEFYDIDNYPMDPQTSRALFFEFIDGGHLGNGWVIMYNGEPVGYVILTFVFSFEYKGRIAFLDELFILPKMRGNGLGKQALEFINQQARLLNIKIIYLEVEGHNDAALGLYKANNYTLNKRKLMRLIVV
ncbi:GNAT family N-acetyltransferase [Flavobacterium rhizosphaerae]|uniref:GNAT family N-acetyltransferase n=1 Tax=Flavobacterium rhizosphaerae TaxID=3163298 RepID=A0ABW8YUB1_9FLAO